MKSFAVATVFAVVVSAASAVGDAPPPPEKKPTEPAEPAQHPDATAKESEGILPVPDYSGEWMDRAYLLGDFTGGRQSLANRGLTFDLNWTQIVQGVVDGGRRRNTEYNGDVDLLMQADLMRMNVLPGALVRFRVQSRYGDVVNEDTGAILPVNSAGYFPLTDPPSDDIPITITELNYTQFLSKHVGIQLGKVQTLDGDQNEFASGRGVSQFMNSNFLFTSAAALTTPYSTLSLAAVALPTDRIEVSTALMLTADSSTTSGFEDFGDGLNWASQVSFQYQLGDLPGGQNVAFVYSFDNEFRDFNSLSLLPIVPAEFEDDTWFGYWSGWQYLWADGTTDKPINLDDGRPDLRGFGLFWRLGVADDDTNPVSWSISGGVGGRGLLPSRPDDLYGVGAYYTSVETNRLFTLLGVNDETYGLEAFYNFQIIGSVNLTIDAQFTEPADERLDTAFTLGARLNIRF